MTGRLKVDIQLHFPTRRLCDIDNRPKAILDALEQAGVFENDSQVDVLTVERREVRKGGVCLVMITEQPATSCEVCDYHLNIDGTCPNDVCHHRKDKRA
jgi:Holliday junction resolvase RusA-like endonuclease